MLLHFKKNVSIIINKDISVKTLGVIVFYIIYLYLFFIEHYIKIISVRSLSIVLL